MGRAFSQLLIILAHRERIFEIGTTSLVDTAARGRGVGKGAAPETDEGDPDTSSLTMQIFVKTLTGKTITIDVRHTLWTFCHTNT